VPDVVLSLRDVSKAFGRVKAVEDVSLDVHAGEILTLLGPSGCGKTTTLRMVAGLERPTAGDILYEGRPIVSVARKVYVPTHQRNVGMVFQSYALWPHMTVFENVAYPLRLRGVKAAVIREKVVAVLETVGLPGLENRPVPALSGGQQQRVALARALVYEPALLLLDEPFSNLDARLRAQMRVDLRLLQRRLGMTCLFVTHDQAEALSLSDRLAIMDRGRVEQIGTPLGVYSEPATPNVRDFLGRVATFAGRTSGRHADGRLAVHLQGEGQPTIHVDDRGDGLAPDSAVEVSIRPEDILVDRSPPHPADNVLSGCIEALLFLGDTYETRVRVGEHTITLELPRSQEWREGQQIYLTLPAGALRVWPRAGGEAGRPVAVGSLP
jgi:ABC-type Fe3+/spermidine/putrescine transport system ATPase subunit